MGTSTCRYMIFNIYIGFVLSLVCIICVWANSTIDVFNRLTQLECPSFLFAGLTYFESYIGLLSRGVLSIFCMRCSAGLHTSDLTATTKLPHFTSL